MRLKSERRVTCRQLPLLRAARTSYRAVSMMQACYSAGWHSIKLTGRKLKKMIPCCSSSCRGYAHCAEAKNSVSLISPTKRLTTARTDGANIARTQRHSLRSDATKLKDEFRTDAGLNRAEFSLPWRPLTTFPFPWPEIRQTPQAS